MIQIFKFKLKKDMLKSSTISCKLKTVKVVKFLQKKRIFSLKLKPFQQVIKRHIMHSKKTAFIVEHDFIMGTYLADSVIVFGGIPSVKTEAMSPKPLVHGFNDFLRSLSITFRRDPKNYRFAVYFLKQRSAASIIYNSNLNL